MDILEGTTEIGRPMALFHGRWKQKLPFLALLVLLIVLPKVVNAEYDYDASDEEDEPVAEMLSLNAYKDIVAGNEIWLIDYFKEDCQSCQQLTSIMQQVAKDVHSFGIKVGIFDLDQKKALKAVGDAGITRLPALKFFVSKPQKNPYTKKMHRMPIDFPFEKPTLDAKMVKKWIMKTLPNYVNRTTADDWGLVLEEAAASSKNVVLMLTSRDTTSFLLKTLAIKLVDDFVFVEVPSTEKDFFLALNVEPEDAPKLYLLETATKGAERFALEKLSVGQIVSYENSLKEPKELKSFLEQYVPPPESKGKRKGSAGKDDADTEKKGKEKKKKEEDSKEKTTTPRIPPTLLNETNFKEVVMKSPEAWMVWFQEDEEQQDAEWEKYSVKSEGMIQIGLVDCKKSPKLCKAEKEGDLKFKAYPYGEDKEEEAKSVATPEEAYKEVSGSFPDLIQRVGDGSNSQLVEQQIGMAFGMGRYPILLFTKKKEPAPLFKALSAKFESVLSFILVSEPDQRTLTRFNNAPVPGVSILLPQDPTEVQSGVLAPQQALRIETYMPLFMGAMKFPSLVQFFIAAIHRIDPTSAKKLVDVATNKKASESTEEGSGIDEGQTSAGGGGALEEIVDAASWSAACPPSSTLLCVIGFLGGAGEDDKAQKVEALREVARLETNSPFRFSWINGYCYTQFAHAFDVQRSKLPSVVIYSPRKKRVASYMYAFHVAGIQEFLRGVLSGKIGTAPPLGEPVVDADVSLCVSNEAEGGAGAEEVMAEGEEEEDIGDLMQEILEEEKRKKEELAAQLKQEAQERKAKEEEAGAKKKKKKNKKKKKQTVKDEL